MASLESAYFGKTATFPTLHGKESVIAPIFLSALGLNVQVSGVNTDQFGTFSGETPRTLPQLETAVAKARAAIALTGIPLALASEGTIGPNPLIPIASSDLETLVFVDSEKKLIIHESFRSSAIVTVRVGANPSDNLEAFLIKSDFPNHALIVRTEPPASFHAVKGIQDIETLRGAITELAKESGTVVIESDLRASYSPSRMQNIAQCARLLAARIASTCPDCHTPGWGSVNPIFGLPCADCGEFVETAVAADQLGCSKCEYKQTVPKLSGFAEARFCSACNP